MSGYSILHPARAYVCTHTGFVEPENGTPEAAESPVRMHLDEMFAELDA